MASTPHYTRRRLLRRASGIGLTVALAGCAGDGGSSGDEAPTPTGTVTDQDSPVEDSREPATATGLDLSESNVVDVSLEPDGEGRYTFDVTIHHDDAGEPGYANWWQVERLDGSRLGRRDLLHAHDQQPFTRSATIEVPETVDCVVVRGHDQTHGSGGQVMLVRVPGGETAAVSQGAERGPVDPADCP